MLMTVKQIADLLQIKPSTLYAWAAQGKIPARKIHGVLRFQRHEIDTWLASFDRPQPTPLPLAASSDQEVDELIARAKHAVLYSRHGETRPRSSLIGKEE